MKTSLTLAILGGYNALMGAIMLVVPDEMGKAAIGEANAADPKLLELASNFHSGLAPALLMIGLTCLFIRKASIETAKQALLAYIIGTAVLFGVFFGVMANSSVMQFSIEMAAPDILAMGLAVYGYAKAK